MPMNRRDALKTLALTAGALAVPAALGPRAALAQAPAAMPGDGGGTYALPPLPYAVDALEPHLDAQTMQIHHDRHHAAYVTNLNRAVAGKADLVKMTPEQLVRDLARLPEDVRAVIRNNGGGHVNHTLLWTSLKKGGAQAPKGALADAVEASFGTFAGLQERLKVAALSVFGSGWAWLSHDPKMGVIVETTPNQDSPITAGRVPLLGVDVWEHAYYLRFQNRRADYVAEFLKVVDWDVVSARHAAALKG
jgi:Fe-Mn family superoxide dismutase